MRLKGICLGLILTAAVSLYGCAAAPVELVRVNKSQIYGKEAVRLQFHNGWVVYLAEDAGPEVLDWEGWAITFHKTDDPI